MAFVEFKKLYVAEDYPLQVQKQLTSDSVVNAIRKIPNNAFRSFFTQRCIVFHNALYAASPQYRMDEHGTILLSDKGAPKFVEEDFIRIGVTIPLGGATRNVSASRARDAPLPAHTWCGRAALPSLR
jgi:hypothetical protein